MQYPFYRAASVLCLAAIAGLAWLGMATPSPGIVPPAAVSREIRFDVQALKVAQKPAPAATEARRRPLFTPARAPFVPAAPPPPIPLPPPVTVVEVPAPAPQVQNPDPPVQEPAVSQTSAVSGPAAGTDETGLQLMGISINGETRAALIASPQLPSGQWVKPGQKVAGWEVVTIERSHIFLRLGNTSTKMQLYVDNPAN